MTEHRSRQTSTGHLPAQVTPVLAHKSCLVNILILTLSSVVS